METKELKIEVPEGYEIDRDKSTFEKIVFKSKEELTYEEISEKLFKNSGVYISPSGMINSITPNSIGVSDATNCTSKKQAKKLLAINKLMNVARYLNGEWKPNWANKDGEKFYIGDNGIRGFQIFGCWSRTGGVAEVYFKSAAYAEKAINILGEETIRLALSTDW